MGETSQKTILYTTLILTNDNRIRIPTKILEKLGIPTRSRLEVYEFKNCIIIQKPVKPEIKDLTSRYLGLKEAISIINAKNVLKKKKFLFEEIIINKKVPRPRNPYKESIKDEEVYTTKA